MNLALSKILKTYTQTLNSFYSSISHYKTVHVFGWESEASQVGRFKIFYEEINKRWKIDESLSLIDIGCGHADLYKYFLNQNKTLNYSGLDISEEFLNICRTRYPQSSFIKLNILDINTSITENYNLACMSGLLNLNIDKITKVRGTSFRVLEFVLHKLIRATDKAVLCNFLHKRTPDQSEFFCYFEPEEILDFLLSVGIKIYGSREDYLTNDFTVIIDSNSTKQLTEVQENNSKLNRPISSLDFKDTKTDESLLKIYTDGGCLGNPGMGAWAFYAEGINLNKSGFEKNTTNNRMELMAAIQALLWALKNNKKNVAIYTDSQYLQKGITIWIKEWKKNSWLGSAKKPIKNQELWQELDTLNSKLHIEWQWIEGHAGNMGNEEAHKILSTKLNELKKLQ